MSAAAILAAISLAARYAALAIQIGTDAAPFIAMIEKWANPTSPPTAADFANLATMAAPFFAKLNDTSKDVPVT